MEKVKTQTKKWVDGKYQFDVADITTLFTVVAVALTITGNTLAGTIIFIINCLINLVIVIKQAHRINLLILQIALLAFNVYFLIG